MKASNDSNSSHKQVVYSMTKRAVNLKEALQFKAMSPNNTLLRDSHISSASPALSILRNTISDIK